MQRIRAIQRYLSKIRHSRVLLSISRVLSILLVFLVDLGLVGLSRDKFNERTTISRSGSVVSQESREKSLRLYLFFIEIPLRVPLAVIRTNGYSLSLKFAARRTRQDVVLGTVIRYSVYR